MEKINNMEDALKRLGLELLNSGYTVGTAEHMTSGLIGSTLSSMCGTSSVYKGSITTFDKDRLIRLLDVSPNVFNSNKLVSSQVACQMALGGLYKLDVNLCIAVVGGDVPSANADDNSVWICSAKLIKDKEINFWYRKLELNGLRGERLEKVITEALNVAYLHITEGYGKD